MTRDDDVEEERVAGRSRESVDARLLVRRQHGGVPSIGLTSLGSVGVLALMLDDLHAHRIGLSLDVLGGLLIGACYGAAAFGPWLLRPTRARPVRVRIEAGGIAIGDERVPAGEVLAVSVAHAARGASVAIVSTERQVRFLEVEDGVAARAIARALGSDGSAHASVPRASSVRRLAQWQAALSVAIVMLGAVHLVAAFGFATSDVKSVAGVATVVLAQLAAFAVVTRAVATARVAENATRARPPSSAAWDVHVALHARAADDAGDASSDDATPATPVPDVLTRVDEPTTAWLARLDALPTDARVYRGDAVSRDVLMATLGDEDAPADARVAAARLLARRFGEPEPALVRVVDDPDVRLRVEAAHGDLEEAAERLDALGPIFRAR